MVDPHAAGALAGYGLLAIACASAVYVGARLRRGSSRKPARWLAIRLVATVGLVGFAAAVSAFGLERPAGGLSDLAVLSGFVLFSAVFLLDVPIHLSHPERSGVTETRRWLPWGIVALPVLGLAYVLVAWPGRAPVSFAEARGDESLMRTRMAWSNRYDVVEDAAMWFLVASLVVAILALLLIQGWRALRGSGEVRRTARRMLAQASLGPAIWLVLVAGLVLLGVVGVSSASPALSFASGLLFEPGLPATFLLLGPLLWGRDLLRGSTATAPRSAGRAANAS